MNAQARPLDDAFLAWWFAPWELGGAPPAFARNASAMARRAGYRIWCDAAGVPADLPASWDSGWQMAALADAAQLRRAARLYAAMLAARLARQTLLTALPLAERRWCMGVAITQPLQALTDPGPATALDAWGIAELAGALEAGFAGLWPRLRIVLGAEASDVAPGAPAAGAATRRLRCWRMCLDRAARDDMREAA
jgi:hypothetical protein